MKHLIFDVETNGFDPIKNRIISIGATMWDDESNEVEEHYAVWNWLDVYPDFDTGWVEGHGITRETMLSDPNSMSFGEAVKQFRKFARDADVIVAFNSPFDVSMVRYNMHEIMKMDEAKHDGMLFDACTCLLDEFERDEPGRHPLIFDSLSAERILRPEIDGIIPKHYNLLAVGERYGFPDEYGAHHAMNDTRRTLDVYKKQVELMRDNGIEMDAHFEQRMSLKYDRFQERFGKKRNAVNYWGCLI